mgnify:CR=1 FL=1
MGVEKDASGNRWVEVAREVPGTVEEVWEAIATGPGIASWFVPTDIELGKDGQPARVISHFSDDGTMDSVSDILSWDAPNKFVGTSADLGPDAPEVLTEWGVKSLSGSTSTVYVRHSFATESDEWDGHLEDWEGGWPWFFNVLSIYLMNFRGQQASAFRVMGVAPQPTWDAWDELAGAIGLGESEVGTFVKAPDELPPLIGTVKYTSGEGQEFGAILRLDEPAAGILSAFAMAMDGKVFLVLDFYFFGNRAEGAVAHWGAHWQQWMEENFGDFETPEDV